MNKLKLFFSYSHNDKETVDRIRDILSQYDYNILSDHQVNIGEDWNAVISKKIKEADYNIIFLTPEYIASPTALIEWNRILGYVQAIEKKRIIPVILKDTLIPGDISNYLYLNGIDDSPEKLAVKISQVIQKIEGQKVAEKEIAAERIEKINTSIVSYVEPVLRDLEKREINLRRMAQRWNVLGYSAIILGIFTSVALVILDSRIHVVIDLQNLLYLAVKGAIILILLLTSSKYAFTLSKSYMNESLKNADRIHAISFGKFYINAFENSINPNDFKEIFQNWNLSKDSSFSSITADNYDPRITDSMGKILEAIKDMSKK